MDNPAQFSDLQARGYVGDVTVATSWLEAVWRALRREVPTLVTSIGAGEVDADDAADLVLAATLRVLRNPIGAESESGQLDDYAESIKYADATQDIYFTAAELRRVSPVGTFAGGWSGSVKYA